MSSVAQDYTTPPPVGRFAGTKPPEYAEYSRTLSDHHRHMLEVESAISPDMIAARSYWTAYSAADIPEGFAEYQYRSNMFPILVIPQYNAVGRRFGYVLRADNPRHDYKTGKAIKYESQPGGRVAFDYNPAMVHLLRDPSVTLHITEGSKKTDSMASQGLLCISLNGVYGFMTRKMIAAELSELDLEGRKLRLIFDNDVMTKSEVADALYRLSYVCDNRGARVENVILVDPMNPTSPAGATKIGADDYFARGGTAADLETLTTLWQAPRRPKNLIEYPDPYARIAELEALTSAQARLITNPLLKDKERAIGFRVITLAQQRKSSGDVGPDGRPRLRASDIANDYRARPPKGESLPATNPDGSHPLTRRQNVKSIVDTLTTAGVLSVGTEPVTRTAANGDTYADTDLVVEVEDVTAAIIKLSDYRVEKQRKTYTRQEPCPSCGEIHERTVIRQTICGSENDPGCGAIIRETTVTLPIPPANDPDATPEQLEDLAERTAAVIIGPKAGSPKFGEPGSIGIHPPSPTSNTYSSPKFGEPEPIESQTCAWPGGCSASVPAGTSRCRDHTMLTLEEYDASYGAPAASRNLHPEGTDHGAVNPVAVHSWISRELNAGPVVASELIMRAEALGIDPEFLEWVRDHHSIEVVMIDGVACWREPAKASRRRREVA